jgi:hypothetical protein
VGNFNSHCLSVLLSVQDTPPTFFSFLSVQDFIQNGNIARHDQILHYFVMDKARKLNLQDHIGIENFLKTYPLPKLELGENNCRLFESYVRECGDEVRTPSAIEEFRENYIRCANLTIRCNGVLNIFPQLSPTLIKDQIKQLLTPYFPGAVQIAVYVNRNSPGSFLTTSICALVPGEDFQSLMIWIFLMTRLSQGIQVLRSTLTCSEFPFTPVRSVVLASYKKFSQMKLQQSQISQQSAAAIFHPRGFPVLGVLATIPIAPALPVVMQNNLKVAAAAPLPQIERLEIQDDSPLQVEIASPLDDFDNIRPRVELNLATQVVNPSKLETYISTRTKLVNLLMREVADNARPSATTTLVHIHGELRFIESKEYELGKGSEGIMYLGLWRSIRDQNQIPVAAKVYHTSISYHEKDLLMMPDVEMVISPQKKAGVISYLALIPDRNKHVIVQELGLISASEYFTKKPKDAEERKMESLAACQVLCQAVAFLHENQIIHRDLRLPNALLCSDGTLKLADFGLFNSNSSSPDFCFDRFSEEGQQHSKYSTYIGWSCINRPTI